MNPGNKLETGTESFWETCCDFVPTYRTGGFEAFAGKVSPHICDTGGALYCELCSRHAGAATHCPRGLPCGLGLGPMDATRTRENSV